MNAVLFQSGHVLRHVATCQQTTMHFRVQSFHAAVQHFWKLSDLRHFGHGQALLSQQLGCTACRHQLHLQRMQRFGEFDDASFVRDRNQCFHFFHFKSLCSISFLRSVLRFRPSHSAARD